MSSEETTETDSLTTSGSQAAANVSLFQENQKTWLTQSEEFFLKKQYSCLYLFFFYLV